MWILALTTKVCFVSWCWILSERLDRGGREYLHTSPYCNIMPRHPCFIKSQFCRAESRNIRKVQLDSLAWATPVYCTKNTNRSSVVASLEFVSIERQVALRSFWTFSPLKQKPIGSEV